MMIHIKSTDYLTDEERMIRTAVFVDEQKFQNEFDDIDNNSVHLVLFCDNKPAACCRYYKGDEAGECCLGRLAVLKEYRGRHFGNILVRKAECLLKSSGAKKLSLSAQVRVSGFYKKLGFVPVGEVYFDEYCEHIHMEKQII